MKLGLGLYRHMLDAKHFRFARQAGATHIVAHLVDYFPDRGDAGDDQPTDGDRGWARPAIRTASGRSTNCSPCAAASRRRG